MGSKHSGRVCGVGFGLTPSERNGANLSQFALTPLLSSETTERIVELETSLVDVKEQLAQSKVHIVQRGVVQPLIEMLKSPYAQLGEMSAFVLGRLAKDKHNQAGIAHSGGIVPPLKLIDSRNGVLQHNSAYSYGILKS
uniref:Uncharacterized protein n=1 Tax=Quercus lobata TaxID=97700 RepID=A0A7N2LP77_QUELO